MDRTEVLFAKSARTIGLVRAAAILSLLSAYEGSDIPEATHEKPLSEKEINNVVSLGERISSHMPVKRANGRKPDPNSAFQRVQKAILDYLKTHKQASKEECIAYAAKTTGLSVAVCKTNAMISKGVARNYGMWSLKAA